MWKVLEWDADTSADECEAADNTLFDQTVACINAVCSDIGFPGTIEEALHGCVQRMLAVIGLFQHRYFMSFLFTLGLAM